MYVARKTLPTVTTVKTRKMPAEFGRGQHATFADQANWELTPVPPLVIEAVPHVGDVACSRRHGAVAAVGCVVGVGEVTSGGREEGGGVGAASLACEKGN